MPREKIHPEYYAVKGHQILKRVSDEDIARELNISVRTYREKVKGYYDFSLQEGEKLSRLLDVGKDDLFLT